MHGSEAWFPVLIFCVKEAIKVRPYSEYEEKGKRSPVLAVLSGLLLLGILLSGPIGNRFFN